MRKTSDWERRRKCEEELCTGQEKNEEESRGKEYIPSRDRRVYIPYRKGEE